jgi:hypothetical protein
MNKARPAVVVWAFTAGLALAASTATAASSASGVNIIYPPKLPAGFDDPGDLPPPPEVAAHEHAVEVRFFLPSPEFIIRERRRAIVRRAFGHRYLGFKKVYSGPRYPF